MVYLSTLTLLFLCSLLGVAFGGDYNIVLLDGYPQYSFTSGTIDRQAVVKYSIPALGSGKSIKVEILRADCKTPVGSDVIKLTVDTSIPLELTVWINVDQSRISNYPSLFHVTNANKTAAQLDTCLRVEYMVDTFDVDFIETAMSVKINLLQGVNQETYYTNVGYVSEADYLASATYNFATTVTPIRNNTSNNQTGVGTNQTSTGTNQTIVENAPTLGQPLEACISLAKDAPGYVSGIWRMSLDQLLTNGTIVFRTIIYKSNPDSKTTVDCGGGTCCVQTILTAEFFQEDPPPEVRALGLALVTLTNYTSGTSNSTTNGTNTTTSARRVYLRRQLLPIDNATFPEGMGTVFFKRQYAIRSPPQLSKPTGGSSPTQSNGTLIGIIVAASAFVFVVLVYLIGKYGNNGKSKDMAVDGSENT